MERVGLTTLDSISFEEAVTPIRLNYTRLYFIWGDCCAYSSAETFSRATFASLIISVIGSFDNKALHVGSCVL
jgi:hypothetical protein